MVESVEKAVGSELTIMAGLSLEDIDFRSIHEIENMTKNVLKQGAQNGRFILIPSDVPSAVPFQPQTKENLFRFIDIGAGSFYPFA